jgi:predicted transcriptional regulator
MRDAILAKILSTRGMVTLLATKCGISTAAVSQWDHVPEKWVEAVAEASGTPARLIRAGRLTAER